MTERSWGDAGRYAIAVAAVLVTVLFKTLLFGPDHPFVLMPGAVAVAAWYGGRGPGLLAALLVPAATVYLMLMPGRSVDLVVLTALLTEGVLVALLTAGLRSALRTAQAASAESAEAHREAKFALAVRDELLHLWTQQLRGPMADLEAQARSALADLGHDGYTGTATDTLRTLVQNAARVSRTTVGWDVDEAAVGKRPPT